MNYLLLTACKKYSEQVYGPDSGLKMPVEDAQKFENHIPDENVLRIRMYDEDCTTSEILAQLKWIATQIKPGERCTWYHSGHGTNWDTKDGRVTGRCLYDGPLWDFTAAKAIEAFPANCEVVIIADTCYSESITRDAIDPNDERLLGLKSKFTNRSTTPGPKPTNKARFKAAVCEISACTSDQVAYEVFSGGLFTSHLRFNHTKTPTLPLAKLVAKVKNDLKTMYPMVQTPTIWTNSAGKHLKKSTL